MQVIGEWLHFDDGIRRPVVWAYISGRPLDAPRVPFLLDIGSDRTVFAADFQEELENLLLPPNSEDSLTGIGGNAAHKNVHTSLELDNDQGQRVTIKGLFAIFTDLETTDISIMGRDVLDNFAVIVDRPGDAVLLLAPRHKYRVEVA